MDRRLRLAGWDHEIESMAVARRAQEKETMMQRVKTVLFLASALVILAGTGVMLADQEHEDHGSTKAR